MAKVNTLYQSPMSTIAVERTVYGTISSLLGSTFTKTADTGQVTWSTASIQTNAYEIFAFNDSMQATAPLFMRVLYTTSSTTTPGLTISIGTGTNGAGTLTGILLSNLVVVGSFSSSAARYLYASADGSYLTLMMNMQSGANSSATYPDSLGAVALERTRDADGSPNGFGVTAWNWTATADNYAAATNVGSYTGILGRYYDTTLTQPGTMYDYGFTAPNLANNTSYTTSNATYVFPAFTQAGPYLGGASKALVFAVASDVPKQTPFTVTHYGTSMQFLALGNAQYATQPYVSAAAAVTLKTGLTPCFRYE